MKALLLAAGHGTRLRPFTDILPKCLMPINGIPLLEYWLDILKRNDINDVLINTHHHANSVQLFASRPKYSGWVRTVYEDDLLGTAGTIRGNMDWINGEQLLLIHADNLSCCDYSKFIRYHANERPTETVMTMMTFVCPQPSSCGVVRLDRNGVVTEFYEKLQKPLGNIANGAVYILEPEVLEWIENVGAVDFSEDVIPAWVGRIATWHNKKVHRDIGKIEMLVEAQKDDCYIEKYTVDSWSQEFSDHKIHKLLNSKFQVGAK